MFDLTVVYIRGSTQPQRDLAPLQSKAVIFHFLGKCVNHVLYYY